MQLSTMLPRDGSVSLISLFDPAKAQGWFDLLRHSLDWKHDEVIMFGKKIITKRMMAWYADPGKSYRYSGITRTALDWTEPLLRLKTEAEKNSGCHFNSCLCNLYHDGSESMGWHRDNEPELDPEASIASISLGADRRFYFRHRVTGEKISLLLDNGSLLLMRPPVQEHWEHQLPAMKRVQKPRINLTFRRIR
ncbi:MAG: alpha-ketoglutarate-dependent dioxygenase AlkB family protein [Bacteroidota bacterium]